MVGAAGGVAEDAAGEGGGEEEVGWGAVCSPFCRFTVIHTSLSAAGLDGVRR